MQAVLLIVGVAFASSMISWWAFNQTITEYKQRLVEVHHRLRYLEVGLSHQNLLPLREQNKEKKETKTFKQEGNIVYLEKEE